MNFFELLELLIARASLNETEMRDAKKLLNDLLKLNAFGAVVRQTTAQDHICKPSRPMDKVCVLCGKELNVKRKNV